MANQQQGQQDKDMDIDMDRDDRTTGYEDTRGTDAGSDRDVGMRGDQKDRQ